MNPCLFFASIMIVVGNGVSRPDSYPVDGMPALNAEFLSAVRELPVDWRPGDDDANQKKLQDYTQSLLREMLAMPSAPGDKLGIVNAYFRHPLVLERHTDILLRFYTEEPARPPHRELRTEGAWRTLGYRCEIAHVDRLTDRRQFRMKVTVISHFRTDERGVVQDLRHPPEYLELWEARDRELVFLKLIKREAGFRVGSKAEAMWRAQIEQRKRRHLRPGMSLEEQRGYTYPEPNRPIPAGVFKKPGVVRSKEPIPGFKKNPEKAIAEYQKRRREEARRRHEESLKWKGGEYRLHANLPDEHANLAVRFTAVDPFPWHRRDEFFTGDDLITTGFRGIVCDVDVKEDHRRVAIAIHPIHRPVRQEFAVVLATRYIEIWKVTDDSLELLSARTDGVERRKLPVVGEFSTWRK